jgi:hypothetical protein
MDNTSSEDRALQPNLRSRKRLDWQFAIYHLQFAILLFASGSLAAPVLPPLPSGPIQKMPVWQPPKVQDVKAQTLAWIEHSGADAATRARAASLWAAVGEQATGLDLLDLFAQTCAMIDPRAAKLVELCSTPRMLTALPSQAWLLESKTPPLVANNLRLYYGRWLVHTFWFDEAIEQLGGLKPSDVVAPAELLFYQSVAYHRTLNKEEGLKSLAQLLDGAAACPRRYLAVGYLMQTDLMALEPDTLDHVARRMEDIERRLDMGHAGPKVRKVENGVIDSIDKLIKKLEDQQKQQANNQSNSLQSSKPAKDSTPMGGRGPGEVTKKNIGNRSGWGDLPPKEREEALQSIGRDFPSHYRDIVEQYFRRLATEENGEPGNDAKPKK